MRYILLIWVTLILAGCSEGSGKFISYGQEIDGDGAIDMTRFLSDVNESPERFKVKGTIEEVCQMKGCWMILKTESNYNVRVTFKDYGYFVPKDISGQEVIVSGMARKEVLSEDMAKHYAEDGGKVYQPSMRETISLVADGILVREK